MACTCHACACHVMHHAAKPRSSSLRPHIIALLLIFRHYYRYTQNTLHWSLDLTCTLSPISSRSHLPILCLYHPQHTRNRTTSPTTSTRTWHDVAHVIRHQTFHHPGHTSNSAAQNSVPIHQKPNQNQAKRVLSFPVVKSVAQALCVSPMKTSKQKTRPCVYAQPNS